MISDPRFGPEPTDGGGFTNFSGTVVDAYFVDGEYGCSLNWIIDLDTPELYPSIENPTKLFVACGSGWSAEDAGDTIVHKDGPNKPFNKRSEIGVLNTRIRNGELENFDAFLADLPDDFSFTRAKSWKGMRFRFDEVSWPTKTMGKAADGSDTGVWVDTDKTRRFPVEYLGKAGGASVNSSNGSASTSLDLASLSLPDDLITAATAAVVKGDDLSAAVIKAGGMSIPAMVEILSDAGKTEAFRKALVA